MRLDSFFSNSIAFVLLEREREWERREKQAQGIYYPKKISSKSKIIRDKMMLSKNCNFQIISSILSILDNK